MKEHEPAAGAAPGTDRLLRPVPGLHTARRDSTGCCPNLYYGCRLPPAYHETHSSTTSMLFFGPSSLGSVGHGQG